MAIDYNGDILPLYDDRLEFNPEYVQELATVSSRGFDDRDTTPVGAATESFLLNTVPVVVGGTATLDDWLAAAAATAPVTGGDVDVAILQQADGDYVLAFAAVDQGGSTVDIVIAIGGGGADALPALGIPAGTVVSRGDLGVGRADQKNEQRILTTLGVLVAHLRLLGDRDEARSLHFVLSRIATGVGSGGFIYDDLSASVSGNVKNPTYTIGAGADEIHLTLVNEGEGTVVTAVVAIDVIAAVTPDLDTLVTDINAAVTSAYGGTAPLDNLEASNAGGYLKLESANGLTIGVVSAGSNNGATNKSGLEFGDNRSKRNEVAEKVKAEALDYFNTERRALNL